MTLLSPPYIVAVCGTMVLLAQREESHLVKLALPLVPMVSDYSFHDTAGMTREEAGQAATQRIFWELLAGGERELEEKWRDPMLFPDKVSSHLLSR